MSDRSVEMVGSPWLLYLVALVFYIIGFMTGYCGGRSEQPSAAAVVDAGSDDESIGR